MLVVRMHPNLSFDLLHNLSGSFLGQLQLDPPNVIIICFEIVHKVVIYNNSTSLNSLAFNPSYGIMMADYSKVNNIFLLLGEGLNLIVIVVLILHQFRVLMNVVVNMPQSHLRLYSFLLDLFGILEISLGVEFLLDGRQQLEPILRRIFLHILKEVSVYHKKGEFLKGLNFSKIH